MLVQIKDGVRTAQLSRQISFALGVASVLCQIVADKPAVVTSAQDGAHSANSLHHWNRPELECQAIDLRTNGTATSRGAAEGQALEPYLTAEQRDTLTLGLRSRLAVHGFQVLLEAHDSANEHIHIEYDPAQTGRSLPL